MICKKCNVDLKEDVILKNGICAFCYHRKKHWSCNGYWTTKEDATINKDNLVCPNCGRNAPNKSFITNGACKWCKKS